MNNDANEQDAHTSEGDTSSAVRRSTRFSAHTGTAAAINKPTEEEGDREVESESESESSDGSAGSK